MVKSYGFAPHGNTGCPPLLAPRQPYGSDMFMQTAKLTPQFLCGQTCFAMTSASERVTSGRPLTCAFLCLASLAPVCNRRFPNLAEKRPLIFFNHQDFPSMISTASAGCKPAAARRTMESGEFFEKNFTKIFLEKLTALPLVFLLLLSLLAAKSSAQCALVCKGNVTVALPATGTATLTPPQILQSSAGCSNNFTIDVTDTLGNHFGNTVNASHLSKPLTVTITHPFSGNSCSANLTVIDNLPPVLFCQDTALIWCNEPTHPDSLGRPEVSDNASDSAHISLVFKDTLLDLACFDSLMLSDSSFLQVTALLLRTWKATDQSGNVSTCLQHIWMKRATVNDVVFPKHRDGVQLPALECSVHNPNNLAFTGQPTIGGAVLDNTSNCDITVSFTDQNVPQCGGAKRIIRTWTIFDLCTDEFRVFAQIIKVLDTTAPAISCPGNVSFATYPNACSAQVWLPLAAATDACSSISVNANWQFGNGYGPFNSVPVGVHTVTYTAKDACNNTATCQITVTVKDEKKPVALCENSVMAGLQEDGTGLIYAETFDNGSYDNCGIGQLLVSRNGEPFDEFVFFSCEDLAQPVQVTLKVVDVHGLESQCTTNVTVADPVQPGILCPPAANLNCGIAYNNPALTGQPYATDNCGVASVTFTDLVNLSSCGTGTILRTWKATDQSGSFATCLQTITIADNTPISVTFPADILTYECEPNTDVSATGEPVIIGRDCEGLQITHTDYLFYTAQPACFKLIRNWAIINWCVFQPNTPGSPGFWEHTQVIEVRDSTAPVLTCPTNFTKGIEGTGCQAFVEVPLPSVEDCSDQLTITNTGFFAQNASGAASGTYPKGTHDITYTASDGCGNTSTCSLKLNVVDAQTPNPVCNNGISVTIQQNGYVTVTPGMIDNGSYDNCSPKAKLVLQVSPNTFACQDLGTKTVMLTATDEAGNSAFCQTNVVVQDNLDVCPGENVATIAGKLTDANGVPLSQKLVGLTGGLSIGKQTDVDGTYDFPNLPIGMDYELTPTYNVKPLNGVTTLDMVFIRRHILGVEKLDSPYKIIAADINKSGSVSTFDLVELRKLILNVTTSFPNGNTSWRFVLASYDFPDDSNPFSQPFPEKIEYDNLETSQWEQNFVGIKIGDVNGSADPAGFGDEANENRSLSSWKDLTFKTNDIELTAGTEYATPFVASFLNGRDASVAGFQFTIDYDENALELTGIEPGEGMEPSHFGKLEGAVTVSHETVGAILAVAQRAEGTTKKTSATTTWATARVAPTETIFTLKFRAKKPTRLSEVLTINSLHTPAEAYLLSEEAIEIQGIRLEFETEPLSITTFKNVPNPFIRTTRLQFQVAQASSVEFRVLDLQGRLLKTFGGYFPPGSRELEIDLGDLPHTGLLFCEMRAAGQPPQIVQMVKSH